MKTYRYSYKTKMGTRQYATKTTYKNSNYRKSRRSSPIGNYIADQTARAIVNLLFK